MAHEIPITSNQCQNDVDLEKGLNLINEPSGDSDEIHRLSSPTTTAVDDVSVCKASSEHIVALELLTLAGSDKSETIGAAIPFIITKACKLHSPFGSTIRAYHMTVESFPVGYPLQAAFQSSEPSFSIYRSFGYLHSRVILQLQDELRSLEDNLEKLDGRDSSREERGDCVTSREADLMQAKRDRKPSERAHLLTQICDKLQRYDEMLLKARELNAFQRPSNRDYRSLRNWFENECHLSSEAEMEFVRRKEDLVTLRQGREWAGFDGWIESSIKKLPSCLSRVSSYLFLVVFLLFFVL